MSDINTLGIMGALLIGGIFLLYRLLAGMHEKNSVIALGVAGGIKVSLEYRWVALLQMVVPVLLFSGVFALLMGFTFLRISEGVEDPGIRSLAQLHAWVFFVASFASLTIGPLGIYGLASRLRKIGRR